MTAHQEMPYLAHCKLEDNYYDVITSCNWWPAAPWNIHDLVMASYALLLLYYRPFYI